MNTKNKKKPKFRRPTPRPPFAPSVAPEPPKEKSDLAYRLDMLMRKHAVDLNEWFQLMEQDTKGKVQHLHEENVLARASLNRTADVLSAAQNSMGKYEKEILGLKTKLRFWRGLLPLFVIITTFLAGYIIRSS